MINRPLNQKTIGLLGGCSNVATGEYYKFLNNEVNDRLGGWEIAETLISGMNFGNIEAFVREDNWSHLQTYMENHVDRLIAGGADLILCVSNTLHRSLEPIITNRDVPFIHIADPTGEAINDCGLRKIILLGTKPVMRLSYLKEHYAEHFGLEIVTPSDDEQEEVDRIIFDELVKFDIRESSRQTYVKIVEGLVKEQQAEGVILGCTEIFLLLRQGDIPHIPVFNTTQLHCHAAVNFALALP